MAPRRRREKEVKNVFDEIMAENLPNLRKENRYPGSGNTENPEKMNKKRSA